MTSWGIWAAGGVLLVAAGFLAARRPHRQDAELRRRTAWSDATTAIGTAAVSRDAAPVRVPEAEQLLTRAELVAARRGGARAAGTAAGLARRADELWRAAADA